MKTSSNNATNSVDITLYSGINFTGETLIVNEHVNFQIANESLWLYQSARLNGNKCFISAPQSPLDPGATDGYEEHYTAEDIPDFSKLAQLVESFKQCYIMPLNADDIILTANVIQDRQRGYTTALSSERAKPDLLMTVAYDFDTKNASGTLAILNKSNLLNCTSSTILNIHSNPLPNGLQIPKNEQRFRTDIAYDVEKDTISVTSPTSVLYKWGGKHKKLMIINSL